MEPYPNMPASISQDQVDAIVMVDEVGDPSQIGEGATRMTTNPKELLLARRTSRVIENSGDSTFRNVRAIRYILNSYLFWVHNVNFGVCSSAF